MVFYHHDLPPEGRPLPGGSLIINLVRIEVLERNFMIKKNLVLTFQKWFHVEDQIV